MLIIRNNIIPFKGFKAINICGILFVRKNAEMSDIDLNHEEIHSKQCWEMLIIFFYLWYFTEWLVRLLEYNFTHEAYKNISFEREAYLNQDNLTYTKTREIYSWLKYL